MPLKTDCPVCQRVRAAIVWLIICLVFYFVFKPF